MQTAFKNIRRSPYQAISAIFVVSITMFIVAMFALVSVASQEILLTFETKPQIIAYLKDGHTPDQVNELLTQLSTTQGVKKAIYISKQDALELYKESVGNDPMLLGTVEITAQTPKSFNSISSVLERSEIVSTTPQGKKEIDFPQDVVAELTKWTNAIRVAGLIMVAALTLVSILTIVIIISMKISGRKLEITTLKLLGARNFYIIKPYIQESFLYGVSGALIGWLTAYIALLYSTPFLSPRIGTIITFPVPFIIMLILLGGMLTFSAALALVSGFFASTRFVKRSK
ncbi:MAG: Efflux ABC transporter, permease protein [Candidatus Collierbacteria bacterium GW2011_GWC2_45_15]|uniref:Cell division protein FtsX n=1 Tax=Candidatus Collierbacteria bacterium GW2011_GWC2_45_15 TaxID=1618394 RepID=A0A0G1LLH8_9BACT|nr:MAG: Efflux ABC transporter, permease protein [Candidatus Collierbacteria bacterium GW2011_GWC2_45_15]